MKITKSMVVFLFLAITFLGWQLISKVDALGIMLGLPGFARVSVANQYVLS